MLLDTEACWKALSTRDARFDGRFYVGVKSTGIYCRPVCTVRAARREHCRFFASAAAAEVDGFRPCLRCRPELAPGFASIDATARLAQAAVTLIEDGFLESRGLDALARRLGVTDRHLRRVFDAEFGVAPVEYAQTQRLLLAKRLLTDTALPVTEIALASGFSSVRRFNALFRERYRMAPTRLRRAGQDGAQRDGLRFELAYRPPYDWPALLAFLGARVIEGVEAVDPHAYRRALAIEQGGAWHTGWIEVQPAHRGKPALAVRIAPSLARVVPQVLARVKRMFDLSCDPATIAAALGDLARRRPGLRVPGCADPFEAAVRAIIGQQVSVRAALTMLARITQRFGVALDVPAPASLTHLFPSPDRLRDAGAAELAACGLTRARARTLAAFAQAVADGSLRLEPGGDVDAALAQMQALPGIGPWTAQYVALRGLAWPDAFLPSDLGVLRALGVKRPAAALAVAETWRPWRAYAVIHLWSRP